MRILIVSQYFWPESFRINDLALALKARGHSVEVLTGMPNYPGGRFYPGYRAFSPQVEDFQGMRVNRVPLIPRGATRNWQLALNYWTQPGMQAPSGGYGYGISQHDATGSMTCAAIASLIIARDRLHPADAAVRDGRIKRGDIVVLEAMGGGFTWGAAALRY